MTNNWIYDKIQYFLTDKNRCVCVPTGFIKNGFAKTVTPMRSVANQSGVSCESVTEYLRIRPSALQHTNHTLTIIYNNRLQHRPHIATERYMRSCATICARRFFSTNVPSPPSYCNKNIDAFFLLPLLLSQYQKTI